MNVQILVDANGREEFAVVPVEDYRRLVARDADAFDIKAAAETDDEESLPWPMAKRLLGGEAPLRVWREHRGMRQRQLAETVGAKAGYLSQIETGRKSPSLAMLRKLANALDVLVDDLIPAEG